MDRRVGIAVMGVAAVGGVATVAYLAGEHGWGGMPPLVPVFLFLMASAPVLAWLRQDVVAWAAVVLLVVGVTLFGLSHGFLIWAALGTLGGMALAAAGHHPRQGQVPA